MLIYTEVHLFCHLSPHCREILLELFTIPSGLRHPEKLDIHKPGHLLAYPQPQVIYEQVEMYQDSSLGAHISLHCEICPSMPTLCLLVFNQFLIHKRTCPSNPWLWLSVPFAHQKVSSLKQLFNFKMPFPTCFLVAFPFPYWLLPSAGMYRVWVDPVDTDRKCNDAVPPCVCRLMELNGTYHFGVNKSRTMCILHCKT